MAGNLKRKRKQYHYDHVERFSDCHGVNEGNKLIPANSPGFPRSLQVFHEISHSLGMPFGRFSGVCLENVRAHCYCASLVRTLFIDHVHATSFSSARTELKTQQNIELMTFALTWCANIFVGCSVTLTFFGRSLPFLTLSIIFKNKKNLCVRSFHILLKKGRISTWIQVLRD